MDICFIVMSVTSEISQLLYLFFDLLVYYPINIHQPQQNLSCEKRQRVQYLYQAPTLSNESCVHFDNI